MNMLTDIVPCRNGESDPLFYKSKFDWTEYQLPAERKARISKEPLFDLIKRKIQAANPQYRDIPWDDFELSLEPGTIKQNGDIEQAVIYLKPISPKYKTRDPKGVRFTYNVLDGDTFFTKYFSVPTETITAYMTENVPFLATTLNLSVYIGKPILNEETGFTIKDYHVLGSEYHVLGSAGDDTTRKNSVINLLYRKEYEGSEKPALFRYRTYAEPTTQWLNKFTNLVDLRAYAFPLLEQYLECIIQKFNRYNVVSGYNTATKTFTYKSPYNQTLLYHPDIVNNGVKPKQNRLNGLVYTNEYFNHPLFQILFTLGSSPVETGIGNGRGNYQYSDLNNWVDKSGILPPHPTVEHHFVYFTDNYLVSGLEGPISESDIKLMDPDFNYSFNGKDAYRKYVIDLATGSLWSSTRYYHISPKTYNTIGMMLGIPNVEYYSNLLNKARELYLKTYAGKLGTKLGIRKTDLFVGS